MRRPWTPDRVFFDGSERMIEQQPKRDCDRCKVRLGDLTDAELVTAVRKRRLSPVHDDCPLCLGFHAVFAEPAPTEPDADLPVITLSLLCPGAPAGASLSSCAAWGPCGCEPDVEVPSTEWVEFLAAPCPFSPTGEHRHLVERDEAGVPYVGAPQPNTCQYLDAVRRMGDAWHDLAKGIVTGPGLYPIEIEMFDADTLVFEPLEG